MFIDFYPCNAVVPEKNHKAVIEDIKNRKMNVGMVSLRWLPEALGKAGEGSHLFDLNTNTENMQNYYKKR